MEPITDIVRKTDVTLSTDDPTLLFTSQGPTRVGIQVYVPSTSTTDVIFTMVGLEESAPSRVNALQWGQVQVAPGGSFEAGTRAFIKVYATRVTSGASVTLTPFELFRDLQ
jgi:hypothetical protein